MVGYKLGATGQLCWQYMLPLLQARAVTSCPCALQITVQVPEDASGCVVVKLEPSTEAATHLQLADVILEVEGVPIAADETIQFRDDERVDYSHLISLKHVGDTLNLKILRQGKVADVSFQLQKQQHLVGILHEVDCLPSYYITGGLVFAPLSLPCMEAVYGSRKWRTLAPVSVLQAFVQQRTSPTQQVVILVQVLSHEINHGYKYNVLPVETFNGIPVHNLAHLAAMVDACSDPYLNFGLEGGRFITLDKQQVSEHTPHILKINNIPSDRSEDLLGEAAAAAAAAGAEAAATATAAAAAGAGGGGAAASNGSPAEGSTPAAGEKVVTAATASAEPVVCCSSSSDHTWQPCMLGQHQQQQQQWKPLLMQQQQQAASGHSSRGQQFTAGPS